jgi:lysine decarboxylase
MSSTPLYTALQTFASASPLRMAMPGHKGKPVPGLEHYSDIDFTELPPTGNLYAPGGAIEEAEQLWAKAWNMDSCLFLTGGSTQGIHTALLCGAKMGDKILVDRVSHRSIHTGMALLDLHPVWAERPWLDSAGVVAPLPPERVEEALTKQPDIAAVCVTSPTYYGVLSDIPVLAEICHRHGVPLIVDGAHGAHLYLTGENPYNGADLVVVSSHKTLRAPGQSALLFARTPITMEQLREASMTFATSSPSYPMMAALDCVRAYYEGEGKERYHQTVQRVAALRRAYPSIQEEDAPLDPARFVLCVEDGFAVEEQLQQRGIYPEMADKGHVVFILTDCDGENEVVRLRRALDELGLKNAPRPAGCFPPLPPLPKQRLSPRQAVFGQKESCLLERSAGAVAGEQLAPYPPGVPVVAPGEEISKKVLSYLGEIGYNKPDTSVCVIE